MSSLNKSPFLQIFYSYLPLLLLFFSVFNEFDFNYLKLDYFSFNFVHLLIFFWTLRNPDHLGYLAIFFAGIINDVVMGLPMGISAISYLTVAFIATYIKNVTVNFSLFTDWFTFIIAIFFSNLIFFILITNFSNLKLIYTDLFYNAFFTFLFYPLFWVFFNLLKKIMVLKKDD